MWICTWMLIIVVLSVSGKECLLSFTTHREEQESLCHYQWAQHCCEQLLQFRAGQQMGESQIRVMKRDFTSPSSPTSSRYYFLAPCNSQLLVLSTSQQWTSVGQWRPSLSPSLPLSSDSSSMPLLASYPRRYASIHLSRLSCFLRCPDYLRCPVYRSVLIIWGVLIIEVLLVRVSLLVLFQKYRFSTDRRLRNSLLHGTSGRRRELKDSGFGSLNLVPIIEY